ncbi:restriction endonuclease subunit M [Streptomyces sp. TSRI0384-2]|uniref:DNA methyltransferase n=1 Tax=Streptomyces TaxID=1883 RepID=UPI000C25B94E|nr:DNA methyltransferase [Streptomyces sp. TSRI0384-2]PJM81905.1 restriction endonuclease subunit M [Streptomyces sp. TSRI0384-2]
MATNTGEWRNKLYYGDNLDVLRENLTTESVDLIYLDPPFNSNRSYNVLFKESSGEESPAQMEAFDDTWTWSHETESLYIDLLNGEAPLAVKDALEAMRKLLGDNDVLAYLVMMAGRLIELHRALKSTGSLYLHCDPTASHYLKMILDAIFGARQYRNEIVWRRTSTVKGNSGQGARHFGRNTDRILFYTKSDKYTFNQIYQPYSDEYVKAKFTNIEPETGRRFQTVSMLGPGGSAKGNPFYEVLGVSRHWRFSKEEMARLIKEGRVHQSKPGVVPRQKYYLDEGKGVELQSLWSDIDALNSQAAERLGYPTQKPLVLLERIIAASSNSGDVVLDPFCGCGTTIDAAQKLGRKWIGIDVTTLAIDLIDARLRHTYTESIQEGYEILGIPKDLSGAQALFKRSPFEFERWCVMLVDGQPNEKQVGDKGIDGIIRIPIDAKGNSHRVIVSVKGGATNPGHVRDLVGTVESQQAAMGVFICMKKPTKAMVDAANHSGVYTYPVNGQKYPRVQLITVEDLLHGKRPNIPTAMLPYFQAQRRYASGHEQMTLG